MNKGVQTTLYMSRKTNWVLKRVIRWNIFPIDVMLCLWTAMSLSLMYAHIYDSLYVCLYLCIYISKQITMYSVWLDLVIFLLQFIIYMGCVYRNTQYL